MMTMVMMTFHIYWAISPSQTFYLACYILYYLISHYNPYIYSYSPNDHKSLNSWSWNKRRGEERKYEKEGRVEAGREQNRKDGKISPCISIKKSLKYSKKKGLRWYKENKILLFSISRSTVVTNGKVDWWHFLQKEIFENFHMQILFCISLVNNFSKFV